MKRSLTLFFFLLLIIGVKAQDKIEGYYNSQRKEFFPKVNITSSRPIYDIEEFKNGYGIISLRELDNGKGLIDTSGNVLIPMRYGYLDYFSSGQRQYLIFRLGDSIGIVDEKGDEKLRLYASKVELEYSSFGGSSKEMQRNENMEKETEISATKIGDLARVKQSRKMGLFSLTEKKYILEPIYDYSPHYDWPCSICSKGWEDLTVTENVAWAKLNGMIQVVDLKTREKSEYYREFAVLSNGAYYIRLSSGERIMSKQAIHPLNSCPFTIEEFFNDHFIVSQNGKFGLMNVAGELTIPVEYNDLYFANSKSVWIKQDSYWALFTYKNEIKTAFDFLEIEKSNELFWRNYVYFTRLDTSSQKLYSDSYVSFSDKTNEVKKFARDLLSLRGTRKLYTCFNLYYGIAKKADGYHVIYLALYSIEPEAWDMVYMVPTIAAGASDVFGYKKGEKYGTEINDIRYDGVLFDSKKMSYYSPRGCIVKNGYIYCEESVYHSARVGTKTKWEKTASYAAYSIE
jgi:WG containing repeat